MTYFVRLVQTYKDPSCDAEKILKNDAKSIGSCVIAEEAGVDALESYLHDLTRVVNRNKRGAKINFNRQKVADLTLIEAYYDNAVQPQVFCVWLSPVKDVCLSFDVERIIDEAVHKESLSIFDQYINQKKGGQA